MRKVYKVEFSEPVNGKRDYYFGSLSAIYDVFTPDQVGCKVSRLWNVGITQERPYTGKKCRISVEEVTQKQRTK